MKIGNGTKKGTNNFGNLLNLGRIDVEGSSDNISRQAKVWERVSDAAWAIRGKM